MDTPYSVIAQLKPIYCGRLYIIDHKEGNGIVPLMEYTGNTKWQRVWFGIDFPPNDCVGGECFIHFDNALIPVYEQTADGVLRRYVVPELENVHARYYELEDGDGTISGMLTDFYGG